MAVGIFGKLPAKRDYVMNGMPQQLMEVLDPWLQAAVAQSRNDLGQGWLDTYLASPIWRFWLGSRIAGSTVIGALMPSVDGVGRYFPLCCVGYFDQPIAPPDLDPHDDWFERLEEHMLQTLTDEGTYEALVQGVLAMEPPEPPLTLVPGEQPESAVHPVALPECRPVLRRPDLLVDPAGAGGAEAARADAARISVAR